ncbi:MAG: DUF2207 domain-containing protein [Clostridia bacterium]
MNSVILIISIILFIYWIILIIKYDYDKKIDIGYTEDIIDKINPIVAGCIVRNKSFCISDIIATILNLVNKNVLKLNSIKDKDKYINIIEIVNTDIEIDEIEKNILDLVMQNNLSVDINKRVEEIIKDKNINLNIKRINKLINNELYKLGANVTVVPRYLKVIHNILFVISIIFITVEILINSKVTLEIFYNVIDTQNFLNIYILLPIIIVLFGVLLYCMSYIMKVIYRVKLKINKAITTVVSNKRILVIALTNAFFSIILFGIISYVFKVNTISYCMIYLAILNIISTDQFMSKHSKKINKLYYNLVSLENKIKDYSNLDDKNIEYYNLWGKYLVFAIAFMLNKKVILDISKNVKNMDCLNAIYNIYNDDLLLNIYSLEYFSKQYYFKNRDSIT